MKELPNHIQTDIYRRFLFANFIYMFKIHFRMQKEVSSKIGRQDITSNTYGWDDT